jgi:hypothetical protein
MWGLGALRHCRTGHRADLRDHDLRGLFPSNDLTIRTCLDYRAP